MSEKKKTKKEDRFNDMNVVFLKLHDTGSIFTDLSQGQTITGDTIRPFFLTAQVQLALRGGAVEKMTKADYETQKDERKKDPKTPMDMAYKIPDDEDDEDDEDADDSDDDKADPPAETAAQKKKREKEEAKAAGK